MCHNIYELQPPTNIFLPAGGGNVLIIIILPPSRSDLKFTEDSWDNMSYVVEEFLLLTNIIFPSAVKIF